MVEIVSGSGLDRILSLNAVQQDAVARQNMRQAAGALERRNDLVEVARGTNRARPIPIGDPRPSIGPTRDFPIETEFRTNRLAKLVRDPETMNQILEITQGADRRQETAGDRIIQASMVKDAYDRSVYISMIDPGRELTVMIAREKAKLTTGEIE
ncbi:MAG: hypothetical protein RIB80_03530 [Rhodospirillales bacterium]|tara:strand:+ start:20034 stop:20498 length:465 start_codon:yes stop_codon:yes gene_type:complete